MRTMTIQENISVENESGVRSVHVALFAICFCSSVLGGTVSALMSGYLPVAVRQLLGNSSMIKLDNISAYISAIFILGWTFGGPVWGIISDYTGRKKALLLAVTCYGVFTVLTGIMPTWWGVIGCRCISGFGVGGVLVISFTLLSEVWPQPSKSVFIGILSIAFPIGIFLAGAIHYTISSWRLGFMIGFIPLIIALPGIWLIRESNNWQTFVAQKNTRSNTVKVLFSARYRKHVLTGTITFGTMLIGLWAVFSWLPTWVQSLITTGNAQKERGLSMMLLGAGGLTGGFVSGWLANVFSLRKTMIYCFAICAAASFVLFKTNPVFSALIYPEIAVLAFFFGVSQGVLSAYIPQLFPVGIRATAAGFCFNIGRLFTALAVLFVGVMESALGGYSNALFIFSLVFIIGWLAMLLVKE